MTKNAGLSDNKGTFRRYGCHPATSTFFLVTSSDGPSCGQKLLVNERGQGKINRLADRKATVTQINRHSNSAQETSVSAHTMHGSLKWKDFSSRRPQQVPVSYETEAAVGTDSPTLDSRRLEKLQLV